MEALLAVVVLALMAAGVSVLYTAGLQSLAARDTRGVLDGHLRSQMEQLISTHFDQLASGSGSVTVDGTEHTVNWTVVTVDLDGDLVPEDNAKQITVSLAGRTLDTIVVDHEGRLGKL